MNRRNFLGLLSALPLVSMVKPAEAKEIVEKAVEQKGEPEAWYAPAGFNRGRFVGTGEFTKENIIATLKKRGAVRVYSMDNPIVVIDDRELVARSMMLQEDDEVEGMMKMYEFMEKDAEIVAIYETSQVRLMNPTTFQPEVKRIIRFAKA